MEPEPLAICSVMQFFTDPSFGTLFFPLMITTTIVIVILTTCSSLSLCFPRMNNIFCRCETCQAYLTSSWSKDFDNLCDWYAHLLKKSPTKTIHIHVLGNTITANPDNVEYMLKTRFENYPKGKNFSMILGDFLGRGIFNVDGESWSFQKKMASLELNKRSITSFAFEIVNYEIQHRLVPLLLSKQQDDDDHVLDLQDVFRRFSFDSICRFSFGLDPVCLEQSFPISHFAVSFDLASKLSAERAMTLSPLIWKMKRLFNVGSEKRLQEAVRMINILAKEVIRQRRKMGFSEHKDLLSRFMSSVSDDKYLRDIVVSFLLAGRDTVASALTSFFWLLAKHPEVESAIRLEADQVNKNKKNCVENFFFFSRTTHLLLLDRIYVI